MLPTCGDSIYQPHGYDGNVKPLHLHMKKLLILLILAITLLPNTVKFNSYQMLKTETVRSNITGQEFRSQGFIVLINQNNPK